MSKLEELIQKYCPEGVEYKSLGGVCDIHKGVQFNKSDMKDEGTYPVMNGGINPSGYVEVFNEQEDTITISQGGASAGYVNFLKRKFWLGAHCYAVKPGKTVKNRYLYHFIKGNEITLQQCQYGAGIPALAKSTIASLEIPVPPLPVQEEIVRVLDTFTELQAKLQAELQAELQKRLQQYNYYRDNLLSFEGRTDVEWKRLEEVCYYPRERVAGSMLTADTYISTENLLANKKGKTSALSVPLESCIKYQKQDILIGNIRPYLRKIWLANNEGGTNGDVVLIRRKEDFENVIDSKYLYYVLSSEEFFNYNNSFAKGAKMPRGDKAKILQYELPIPTLNEQERIASILDRFDTLTNDLTAGLPAEIEKRRQQYEYYRDQLLTFKRAN